MYFSKYYHVGGFALLKVLSTQTMAVTLVVWWTYVYLLLPSLQLHAMFDISRINTFSYSVLYDTLFYYKKTEYTNAILIIIIIIIKVITAEAFVHFRGKQSLSYSSLESGNSR